MDFTNSSSSSSTTTPRRRNRRNKSSDSLDSEASTSTAVLYSPIAKAKGKVQLQKKHRLEKFIEESEEILLKKANDLRDFAKTESGLVNDTIRSKVWPILAETIEDDDSILLDESSSSESDSDFETALSSLSVSDDGQILDFVEV